MTRIKIEDLPKDRMISQEEMKNAIRGGTIIIFKLPSMAPSPRPSPVVRTSAFTLTPGPCIMTET